MLIHLINGNVNFDQSVKVMSARFLHCWIMNFSFTISNIMGRYFETVHLVYFLSNLHQPILASISGPFLQQLLLGYFSDNFLFSSFTCTNWSSARKSCPFSFLCLSFFLSFFMSVRMFYCMDYNPILYCHLFCWSNCSRSLGALGILLLCFS